MAVRLCNGQFPKGVSGNPSGRPKVPRAHELCQILDDELYKQSGGVTKLAELVAIAVEKAKTDYKYFKLIMDYKFGTAVPANVLSEIELESRLKLLEERAG